ncbi:MAG: hypothetical protein AB7J32_08605 [Pseudonocardia sp.]
MQQRARTPLAPALRRRHEAHLRRCLRRFGSAGLSPGSPLRPLQPTAASSTWLARTAAGQRVVVKSYARQAECALETMALEVLDGTAAPRLIAADQAVRCVVQEYLPPARELDWYELGWQLAACHGRLRLLAPLLSGRGDADGAVLPPGETSSVAVVDLKRAHIRWRRGGYAFIDYAGIRVGVSTWLDLAMLTRLADGSPALQRCVHGYRDGTGCGLTQQEALDRLEAVRTRYGVH